MTDALHALLRCPFCGGSLNIHERARRAGDGRVLAGVVWCECCAFPVVDGIPVLKTDEATRVAMQALDAGRDDDALMALLGLEPARAEAFRALRDRGTQMTYRAAIDALSPDAEGTYFVYRFSDPTFVMAEAILAALAQEPAAWTGRVLDLCGGSGHLSRVLTQLNPAGEVVLADMFFWKLWLAKTFVAPGALPVCCDANHPLPFARGSFPTVVLSDAFPYIWQKRLLAEEMMRQAGPGGIVVMPHLHNSLGWNFSAGMPLTPHAYAALFAGLEPRLFTDDQLLEAAVGGTGMDLSGALSPEAIGHANAFTLVASRDPRVFRRYPGRAWPPPETLVVNPLYRVATEGGRSVLTLAFPTPEYAEEFADCRRYLPDVVTIDADLSGPIDRLPATIDVDALRGRRVLIDAPPRYC